MGTFAPITNEMPDVFDPPRVTDYWNSVKYTLSDAVVTPSANISATQLANGDIQIDVATGKTPDSNPTTGLTIAWKMRDSLTGKETNFGSIGYQGILQFWLGVVSGLGGSNNIEISIGVSQVADLSANSVTAGSITDNLGKVVSVWRWIPSISSFSRATDSSGTGTSTAVYYEPGRNSGTGIYIQGSYITAIGLTGLDPRDQTPAGTPFDSIASAIGNVGVGEYLIINIRNAGLSNVAADRSYVIRPKLLALDWSE